MAEIIQPGIIRKAVLSEIEEWKKNPPEGYSWHSKLNNFHAYLPSDDFVDYGRAIGYFAVISGLLDVKNCDSHTGDARDGHSELFLSQTPRQFFEEIDKTIDEIPEVSLEKIKSLQHEHYEVSKDIHLYQGMPPEEEVRQQKKIEEAMKFIRALCEYTLPVYVELRVKGYSHFDLTG